MRVKYRQTIDSIGAYNFYRIIDLTPERKIFKRKIKKLICSTFGSSKNEYCNRVKRTLSLTKEQLAKQIKPDIVEYLAKPSLLNSSIGKFEMEVEISD